MRTSLPIVLLVAAACRGGEPPPPAPTNSASSAAVVVEAPPRVAPHSGAIRSIAVTDDGDVAYSIDSFGQGRLWLALDGTREPVIVRGGDPQRVVLGRSEDGFVAALLDAAAGLELVRFDRDGKTRGHVTLPPDPGFLDAIAVAGGILARRRDQALVLYDAGGKRRGELVADAGQRIVDVTTRHGRVLAALVAAEASTTTLRWVDVAGHLAWGEWQPLPRAIEAPIALSPSGTKIAGVDPATKRFEVIDLVTRETIYAMGVERVAVAQERMGFIDDTTLLVSDGADTLWWTLAQSDPWATSRRGTASGSSNIAIGDDVMLDASSTSLAITTQRSSTYLGYRYVGSSVLWSTPSGVATHHGANGVWLGRDLRVRETHVAPSVDIRAIAGDHHLVMHAGLGSDGRQIYVTDLATATEHRVGVYFEAVGVTYDTTTQVILVTMASAVERFALTLSPFAIARLPPLVVEPGFGQVLALDPKSTGMAAVVATRRDGALRLDWYRERAGATKIEATLSTTVKQYAMPIGADRRGVVYFFERAAHELLMVQPGTPLRALPVAVTEIATAVVHPDGTLVVAASAAELVAFDTTTGEQRWKLPVSNIHTLLFSGDGQTLFASGEGGLVSIEPRNGTRIATGCGWSFGLHEEQVSAMVFNVPNLCGDLE